MKLVMLPRNQKMESPMMENLLPDTYCTDTRDSFRKVKISSQKTYIIRGLMRILHYSQNYCRGCCWRKINQHLLTNQSGEFDSAVV